MRCEVGRDWEDFSSDAPPCEGVVDLPCIRVDERIKDDPAKIEFYKGKTDWWYKQGRNHRVEDGRIKRDFDDRAWYVEIDSLEALKAFFVEHDCKAVCMSAKGNGDFWIELGKAE